MKTASGLFSQWPPLDIPLEPCFIQWSWVVQT